MSKNVERWEAALRKPSGSAQAPSLACVDPEAPGYSPALAMDGVDVRFLDLPEDVPAEFQHLFQASDEQGFVPSVIEVEREDVHAEEQPRPQPKASKTPRRRKPAAVKSMVAVRAGADLSKLEGLYGDDASEVRPGPGVAHIRVFHEAGN